jgi:hypothetical protein
MLEGKNTPSCATAILIGDAFAGEGVRGRCFGVYAWQGIAAALRRSLSLFSAWRYWPVYIGSAISWETHAEASSVCSDRHAAM